MKPLFPPIEASVRHDYARVNGVTLHYAESAEQRGSTTDQIVILLHGFPECWYSWRHQLKALGKNHRVIAVDLRGYNLSDKPARVEDYRIDILALDVIGLIDHFGARQAAIVGHDWGAAIAWMVAAHYPERVRKLAALQVPPIAAWIKNMTFEQALRSWYMLFFQLPQVPEWIIRANDFAFIRRAFKQNVNRAGTFTDTDIAVYKQALREPNALTCAINYYRANFASLFLRQDGTRQITKSNRIQVPTLFIYGEKDFAILPETVRGVERFIDAPYREVRIPTSNHWVQQEAFAEVNDALADFLEAA